MLVEIRLARELTRVRLAKKTGFSNAFIGWYEDCAKNPTAKTMMAYAGALDISFIVTRDGLTVLDGKSGEPILTDFDPHIEP